jgi:NagD protein
MLLRRILSSASSHRFLSSSVNASGFGDLRAPTELEFQAMQNKAGFIIDMDGVIYHGGKVLPGAQSFIQWLQDHKKKFLFLTNSSERSPRELKDKLARLGIDVDADHFYTSALSTAAFLAAQRPNGTAFVIGEPGLTSALYDVGYSMNDVNPDFVVCGETRNYNYEKIEHGL